MLPWESTAMVASQPSWPELRREVHLPVHLSFDAVCCIAQFGYEGVGVLVVVPNDVGLVVGAVCEIQRSIEIAFSDDGHAEVLGVPFIRGIPFSVADSAVNLLFDIGDTGQAGAVNGQSGLSALSDFDVFPGVLCQGVGVGSGGVGDGGGESGASSEGAQRG